MRRRIDRDRRYGPVFDRGVLADGRRRAHGLAIAHAIGFTVAGHYLWHGKNSRTPGGLLVAVAVSMAPLAVYGIQDALGWWGKFGKPGTVHDFYVWIKGSWVFMEIATVAAGAVALRYYRFPFIVALIAFALWFYVDGPGAMVCRRGSFRLRDAAQGVDLVRTSCPRGGLDRGLSQPQRRLCLLAASVRAAGLLGRRYRLGQRNRTRRAVYCLFNVGLLAVAVILTRRAYAVFGAFGVCLFPDILQRRFSRTHC